MSGICQVHFSYLCPAFTGNDVKLFESKQLDERNNNVTDDEDDVVVLPSAPHSKSSSSTSSPPSSLRSSPSSSPLSPSSASSSDAVSTCSCTDIGLMTVLETIFIVFLFHRTLMAPRVKQPSSSLAEAPAITEKRLLWSVITAHRATLPALLLQATKVERYVLLHLQCNHHCAKVSSLVFKKSYLDCYVILSSSFILF